MGLEDWLQSGKWASVSLPDIAANAGRALEGLGSTVDRARRGAKTVGQQGKERAQEALRRPEVTARLDAARERAESAREKGAAAVERALRFVKEKPAARIARTGVQVKAGLTGFGAGYLLPDVEVLFLGVGGQGRWLAQSGVPAWGAERLAHYLLANPPRNGNSDRWNLRRELYGTVAAPLLTGLNLGLGVRLVTDAVNFRGLPDAMRILVSGKEMVWERLWMLGNGVWCFAMGRDLLLVTLGRRESETLTEMLRALRRAEEADTMPPEADAGD